MNMTCLSSIREKGESLLREINLGLGRPDVLRLLDRVTQCLCLELFTAINVDLGIVQPAIQFALR